MNEMKILAAFGLTDVTHLAPFGEGHINSTFEVRTARGGHYVLQRINTAIFADVPGLMNNIFGVTEYLKNRYRREGNTEIRVLRVVKKPTGEIYHRDETGHCYRLYDFLENTFAIQIPETPAQLFEAGVAFGQFTEALAEYPADKLTETIPHFHDTALRYRTFEAAVREDVCGRAADVAEEIAFVRARAADTEVLVKLLKAGALPLRVTHNDTKLNNVLFDRESGRPVAVIDLDTVMPGLSLYDFGDAIRSGSNSAAEDERDLSRVRFLLPNFEAYTRGYLKACGKSLSKKEIELLPFSAKLMTLECGMRFLTDHLKGDVYFKIHREGHNLDRCRTQLKLVEEMEALRPEMERIVAQSIAE